MTTITTKNGAAKFPSGKIRAAVSKVLPKGKRFQVKVSNSNIGKMKIVRVVTPAWKTLRPSDRIARLLTVVNGTLTEREQNQILRFSVLTPEEYKRVVSSGTRRAKSDGRSEIAIAG